MLQGRPASEGVVGLRIQVKAVKRLGQTSGLIIATFLLGVVAVYGLHNVRTASATPDAQVVINEFSANASSDWVELYNTTDQPVSIEGWKLRDSTTGNQKELLGTIEPHGFVAFDFNDLDVGSDTIRLIDQTDTEIDSVTYNESGPIPYPGDDKSTARTKDGGTSWVISDPTRSAPNDEIAPTLTLLQPANGQVFGDNQTVTIEAQVADNMSLQTYRISDETGKPVNQNNAATYSVGVTVKAVLYTAQMREGQHTFTLQATDDADNHSEEKMLTITIDKTPPVVSVTGPTGTVGGNWLGIYGSVTDETALAEYHYHVYNNDDTLLVAGTEEVEEDVAITDNLLGTWNIAGYPSGDYYVELQARDQAGHRTFSNRHYFTIDHTEPVGSLGLASSAAPTANTPISLQGNVEGGDIATLFLLLDGEEIADLTDNIDAHGNWQYELSDGLPQDEYIFSVVATDHHGNVSNRQTSPSSTIEVNVGPYLPPVDATINPDLTDGLEEPFVVPSAFGIVPTTFEDPSRQIDTDVLGVMDKGNVTVDQNAKNAAIAATESGWKVFGMLWYWWVLLVAALVLIVWGMIKIIRRKRMQRAL